MIISVHQPQYIPWLGYFDKIRKSDAFVYLDAVQYKVREFQNRNKIRTKNGWIWLSVPVVTKGLGKQVINAVRIDNGVDWRKEHLMSLKSWYGRAPYFSRYFPFFEDTYKRDWDRLCDISLAIIAYILKELEIETPIYFESRLGITGKKTDRIVEICGKLKAESYLSGAGGRDYLEEEKFRDAGIKLIYQDYKHPIYHQQFMKTKDDFLPYMSVLDLIFNEGPNAADILKEG